MKVKFVEFPVTFKCNQNCSYCNVYTLKDKYNFNLVLLKDILNQLPNNIFAEITGGEPGLLDNLVDIVMTFKEHKNVRLLQLNSNGLVRKRYPDLIKEVDFYNEHLIHDIVNGDVKLFYNDLEIDFSISNVKYVIVTTENVVNSIFKYNKQLSFLFNKHVWFKLLNQKVYTVHSYINKLLNMYKMLQDKCFMSKTYFEQLRNYINGKQNNLNCILNPHSPAISLITMEIFHCSINYKTTLKCTLTKRNVDLFVKNKLFTTIPDYCKDCYCYSNILFTKPYNREVTCTLS